MAWLRNDHSVIPLINDDLWSVIIGKFHIKTIELNRLTICTSRVGDRLSTAIRSGDNIDGELITILHISGEGDLVTGKGGDAGHIGIINTAAIPSDGRSECRVGGIIQLEGASKIRRGDGAIFSDVDGVHDTSNDLTDCLSSAI